MVSDNIININQNKICKISDKQSKKSINNHTGAVINRNNIVTEGNKRKNKEIIKSSDKTKTKLDQKEKIIKQSNSINPFIKKKVNFNEDNCDLLNKIQN